MVKPVIFSGIQPTGNLHVGNYLGAVKQWVELQNSDAFDCYFCIVDYHSLTGNIRAEDRREQIIRTAVELLALGIDPDKSTFFVQSHVPEHTELAWVFSSVTPIAELNRMTQYKDKSKDQKKHINVGLLTYPILQAADILLYHGNIVPVGEDQAQHVELTCDIARWFNKRYGDYFPETRVKLTDLPRVKSLLDPTKKMSKSLGLGHVIELADEPDVVQKKLMKAVTATVPGKCSPGVENLLLLLKHVARPEMYQTYVAKEKIGTILYGDLKCDLAEEIANGFTEFRSRRQKLLKNQEVVSSMLDSGAKKARAVAMQTMERVRELIGVRCI